jgi:hypothetical protein
MDFLLDLVAGTLEIAIGVARATYRLVKFASNALRPLVFDGRKAGPGDLEGIVTESPGRSPAGTFAIEQHVAVIRRLRPEGKLGLRLRHYRFRGRVQSELPPRLAWGARRTLAVRFEAATDTERSIRVAALDANDWRVILAQTVRVRACSGFKACRVRLRVDSERRVNIALIEPSPAPPGTIKLRNITVAEPR